MIRLPAAAVLVVAMSSSGSNLVQGAANATDATNSTTVEAMAACPTPLFDSGVLFADLPADKKEIAVNVLGYKANVWNSYKVPKEYREVFWDDMSAEDKIAFKELGYTRGSFEDFFEDYDFSELPPDVKVAAITVGYKKSVWDNCEEDVCADIDDKDWDEMTADEHAALGVLGYDCYFWHVEEEE